MGINGEAIAYIDRKPIFIDGAFPDEDVEIEYKNSSANFYKTKALRIVKKSEDRIEAKDKNLVKCGYSLLPLKYEAQLKYKRELLVEALYKYAGIQKDKVSEIIGSEFIYNYRNQCKLPFGYDGNLYTGLYLSDSNVLVKLDDCIIHDKKLEEVRSKIIKILRKHKIRTYDFKSRLGLRNLVIRCLDNKCQVTLVCGKNEFTQNLIDEIMGIDGVVSLYQNINVNKNSIEIFGSKDILLGGEKCLDFSFNNLEISLLPKSFFQLNSNQASVLYNIVRDNVETCDTLVEAYCGVGVMSLMVKDKAKKIIGIENVIDAIESAKINAEKNNIDNVEFICDDAAKALNKINKVDCLIVDPPRSGLDDEMIKAIINKDIKQLIYVSCNPATLGKNLKELKKYYKTKKIIPLDMFSHTAHVETVCLMSGTEGK